MFKLIASDMDETFLDRAHRIPASNLEALRTLKELGVRFVPSSGRGYLSIMDNFAEVDPALMEGSYVISYNGGTINRFGDPDPLVTHELDHELADRLWNLGHERGICMHGYTPDCNIYVQSLPPSEQAYLASLKRIVPLEDADLSRFPVVSKMLYMSDDFAWLHEFAEAEIRPLLGSVATLTYSSGRYLEINPAGVSKGNGLHELARMLGIDVSETIGLGDSANDLEMIQMAGLGVGVANVTEDVRPSCGLVLNTSGMDGALPEIIERAILPSIN